MEEEKIYKTTQSKFYELAEKELDISMKLGYGGNPDLQLSQMEMVAKHSALLSDVANQNKMNVYDVAAGTGFSTKILSYELDDDSKLTYVDPDKSRSKYAKEILEGSRVDFIEDKIESIKYFKKNSMMVSFTPNNSVNGSKNTLDKKLLDIFIKNENLKVFFIMPTAEGVCKKLEIVTDPENPFVIDIKGLEDSEVDKKYQKKIDDLEQIAKDSGIRKSVPTDINGYKTIAFFK